jgi:predicted transposase
MMRSKLIGSKEVSDNFQFVTINGRVEFEGVERISRITYYYSKAVKAGINLALKGVSLNDAVKELYKIIPYAFYAETAGDYHIHYRVRCDSRRQWTLSTVY